MCDLVAEWLEREDGRLAVETAGDAEEALDRLADAPPDCVVSDYEMPGMDGLELLAAVRVEHPDLPFILFTGKAGDAVAEAALATGADGVVRKGGGRDRYALLAERIDEVIDT